MTIDTFDLNTNILICRECGEASELKDCYIRKTKDFEKSLKIEVDCGECGQWVGLVGDVDKESDYTIADRIQEVEESIDNVMSDERLEVIRQTLEDIRYDVSD